MRVTRRHLPPTHRAPHRGVGSRLLVAGWMVVVGLAMSAAEPEPGVTIVTDTLELQAVAPAIGLPEIAVGDRSRVLSCDLAAAPASDSSTRIWSGLAAARCARTQDALRLLSVADPELGDLDQWRFIVHTEMALASGVDPGLKSSWQQRPAWVRDQLEMAWAGYLAPRDTVDFWHLYQPRLDDLARAAPTELDEMAWSLAVHGDPRRHQVAIRLLVHSPVQASVLQVVESLRDEAGSIDWFTRLGPELLRLRAQSLIGAEIPAGALTALDVFPVGAHDFDWHLLRARALTLDRRGAEAWTNLSGVTAGSAAEELELARARAEAALDAAQVRRGRTNLDSAARTTMRARGHQQLDLIATRAPMTEQRADALRRRVADLDNDDSAAEVSALVAALAELDPEDRSAERWLWERGWKQYHSRNWTGAIGWWRQLLDTYPRGRESERARYWSGRAHAKLGNLDRAHELWGLVATSPVDHYYARRARERLPGSVATHGQRFATGTAPAEPRLELADWMVDAGLPELARREMERQALDRPLRADEILEARVASALGDRRQAIHAIRRAYRDLGTPQEVDVPRFALEIYYPRAFEQEVKRNAALSNLEPTLVWGIIRQESAFDPLARSRSGARGLMQLMPPTGREQAGKLGLRYSLASLNQPDYNLRLGTSYFRRVLDMFDGNLELALAGYNSGPFRLRRMVTAEGSGLQLDEFIEGLPWAETRGYVRRIVLFRDSFATLYPDVNHSG